MSEKPLALAAWLPTCKFGDLSDAFGAGWDARQAEIERLRAALEKAEKTTRGVSTAESKALLLSVVREVRDIARDALRGADETAAAPGAHVTGDCEYDDPPDWTRDNNK